MQSAQQDAEAMIRALPEDTSFEDMEAGRILTRQERSKDKWPNAAAADLVATRVPAGAGGMPVRTGFTRLEKPQKLVNPPCTKPPNRP